MTMDGMGTITWWGITPALDFQAMLPQKSGNDLNILLIGASDCRHILTTLAHSYRHKKCNINFYVTDTNVEHYARHLLLMALSLEPQTRLGLQEKMEMFLELFANTLVRQQSMEYVQRMSTELIKMITNSEVMDDRFPLFDVSNLKFKERDLLEGVFKFWRNKDLNVFDIQKCWDLRLRQNLGVRYDSIPNVFDWDFHMKLVERQASIINNRKYNRWRSTGVAYEIREASYSVPNRTLGSIRLFQHAGDRAVRLGYWGDIITSPYIAFGVESEEESFFKTTNNILIKTSEDVSSYNVLSLLHELLHHSAYKPSSSNHQTENNVNQSHQNDTDLPRIVELPDEGYDESHEEIMKLEQLEVSACSPSADQSDSSELLNKESVTSSSEKLKSDDHSNNLDESYKSVSVDNAKVYLLPLNFAQELNKKQKYQRFFNLVYISNWKQEMIQLYNLSHQMTSELTETFADGATVVMDTAKFVLDLSKEQIVQYADKIIQLATSNDCTVIGEVDKAQDSHIRFKFGHRS